jgi:hypothetical protein
MISFDSRDDNIGASPFDDAAEALLQPMVFNDDFSMKPKQWSWSSFLGSRRQVHLNKNSSGSTFSMYDGDEEDQCTSFEKTTKSQYNISSRPTGDDNIRCHERQVPGAEYFWHTGLTQYDNNGYNSQINTRNNISTPRDHSANILQDEDIDIALFHERCDVIPQDIDCTSPQRQMMDLHDEFSSMDIHNSTVMISHDNIITDASIINPSVSVAGTHLLFYQKQYQNDIATRKKRFLISFVFTALLILWLYWIWDA